MVQGTGLHVLVERAISLNRPLRTRTVGGVGAGSWKLPATRLGGIADIMGSWNLWPIEADAPPVLLPAV